MSSENTETRIRILEATVRMLEEHGASKANMRRSASKTVTNGIVQRFINFVQNGNAKGKE